MEGGSGRGGLQRDWEEEDSGRTVPKEWEEGGMGVPKVWEAGGGVQHVGKDHHQLHLDHDEEEEVLHLVYMRIL